MRSFFSAGAASLLFAGVAQASLPDQSDIRPERHELLNNAAYDACANPGIGYAVNHIAYYSPDGTDVQIHKILSDKKPRKSARKKTASTTIELEYIRSVPCPKP